MVLFRFHFSIDICAVYVASLKEDKGFIKRLECSDRKTHISRCGLSKNHQAVQDFLGPNHEGVKFDKTECSHWATWNPPVIPSTN